MLRRKPDLISCNLSSRSFKSKGHGYQSTDLQNKGCSLTLMWFYRWRRRGSWRPCCDPSSATADLVQDEGCCRQDVENYIAYDPQIRSINKEKTDSQLTFLKIEKENLLKIPMTIIWRFYFLIWSLVEESGY